MNGSGRKRCLVFLWRICVFRSSCVIVVENIIYIVLDLMFEWLGRYRGGDI